MQEVEDKIRALTEELEEKMVDLDKVRNHTRSVMTLQKIHIALLVPAAIGADL